MTLSARRKRLGITMIWIVSVVLLVFHGVGLAATLGPVILMAMAGDNWDLILAWHLWVDLAADETGLPDDVVTATLIVAATTHGVFVVATLALALFRRPVFRFLVILLCTWMVVYLLVELFVPELLPVYVYYASTGPLEGISHAIAAGLLLLPQVGALYSGGSSHDSVQAEKS